MTLEEHKSYIQKNPLMGRRVIHVERLRPSVWDWDLCDLTVVKLEDTPSTEEWKSLASSVYQHQELQEIPNDIFSKLRTMVRHYEAICKAAGTDKKQPEANETLARCLQLLAENNIIDETTYDQEHLLFYAQQYEAQAKAQMQQVTDVIDVHK